MKANLNPLLSRVVVRGRRRKVSASPGLRVSRSSSSPSEHEEQKALMIWATAQLGRGRHEFALLFAIPNGGHRAWSVAGKLKAEGVRPGVPDLFLPLRTRLYCGLFVEMKRVKGGKLSHEQRWWHERLRAGGYAVAVCKGAEEAIRAIENYLKPMEKGDGL